MSKQQALEQRLCQKFQPHFITVENESHMHSSGVVRIRILKSY